jgi:Glyoxalase-like domain
MLLVCIAPACQNRSSPPARISSVVELDHVYLYAPTRSTEAEVVAALTQVGFRVSQRNEFPDGVVGRYVRFDNAYLEVLWYDGTTPTDADTRWQSRWESTGASPIGIGLHRAKAAPQELPFPTRGFVASWLPPGTEMRLLGTEADTQAPSMFVVPEERAYADTPTLERQLATAPSEELKRRLSNRAHPLGVGSVTAVRAVIDPSGISNAVRMLSESGLVEIVSGNAPLLELSFDYANQRESRDLRPLLPLVLTY